MEDLKQIQEFFSKPLEEGKQLDIEDFAKVVQAVTKTGHPVTVLLTPKFNEIEVLTGMNAPDDMLRDLSNVVDSLGYGRNDIIIAGDSSNLSRREYSDIRRVNGGHKDYFEESVNEAQFTDYTNNELNFYAREKKQQRADYALRCPDPKIVDKLDKEIEAITRELKKRSQALKGLTRTDEAKVEVDDKTEFKLDLKHLLDKHVVEQGYSLTKEHETDPNLELKVGDYQTQHFHMCPGAKSLYQDIENKVEDMGLAIRSAKLQDALFAMEESALENGANEADVFAAETVADQIMAMAAMMGLDKEHSYIQGHVDKIKGAVDKDQVAESSTSEERRIAKRAIRSIAKYRGVSEDEARNDLIRAANELGDLKENMLSLDDQAKAYYLEKLKKGEIDTLPEDPKAAFLNQMTKDQMDHDAETLRRERGLEESAAYIAETIKLGLMVNEELCDKGKRYIKARQAAGEKSSAYLSGRAVRVCKGQIEWPKKGKKKK